MGETVRRIRFFGERPTDLGTDGAAGPPDTGVLPILASTLCGHPKEMWVGRERFARLHGKGFWQKVWFAKRQSCISRCAGVVFVVDSEGPAGELKHKMAELHKGRGHGFADFPMAIGVAQPCIESWLLADAAAIRRGLELPRKPGVPEEPEGLPAPCQDPRHNPKTVLAQAAGDAHADLAADRKWRIAAAMRDMDLARRRCPLSFAPFADEVERHIRPLFGAAG